MLLKMSLKNYKSFKNAVTLDLVSSTKVRALHEHVVRFNEMKVLRNAVIYGANASGKSNLYKAFAFIQEALKMGALPLDASSSYCKIGDGGRAEESAFDLLFEIDGEFFDYGFSAVLAEREIASEWLYRLEMGRGCTWSQQKIYERRGSEAPVLGDGLSLEESEYYRFELYASDFSGAPDRLFLSELNRGKKYATGSFFSAFERIYSFLVKSIRVIGANDHTPQTEVYLRGDQLEIISELLSGFDTGINEVKRERITMAELNELLPPPIVGQVRALLSGMLADGSGAANLTIRSDNAYIIVTSAKGDEPVLEKICLRHEDSLSTYEFAEESDGTQRLFDFIDLLLTNDRNAVFVIDEINRSLHPMLTKHLIELFGRVHACDRVQLVCTTHEDALMDLELLRKDEIWFVERKIAEGSRLYSLDVFADVKTETSVEKRYWEGRYGGVPVLSDMHLGSDLDAAAE